jgi:lipopolysaccharide/colanic/teichoic acid biosynthesis glycosyltransferase
MRRSDALQLLGISATQMTGAALMTTRATEAAELRLEPLPGATGFGAGVTRVEAGAARSGVDFGRSGAGVTRVAGRPLREPLLKRSFDIALAAAGLLLSAPLWAVIALAIKLDDGGPVLYPQERAGRGGTRFRSLKFRSMVVGSDALFGPLQARARDPRVTRVGRLLRATAMDELPQLWNILVGEMSFVGPRALLPEEIEVNGRGEVVPMESVPGYALRQCVRPGLTGLAQVYAPRDITRRHKFRYDAVYARRQSFWLDLRLVAASFWISFRGKWEDRGDKLRAGRVPPQ